MSVENLAQAFAAELRDILSAEKQLLRSMPKLLRNSTSPELGSAIRGHLAETGQQLQRIEESFAETGLTPRSRTCEAMKGLVREVEAMLQEEMIAEVRDAMIIAHAQKIEHYEIATYGTLCAWAKALGYVRAFALLQENLAEEQRADKALSVISRKVNQRAIAAAEEATAGA